MTILLNNSKLEEMIFNLSNILHKKQTEIIEEALLLYYQTETKKNRLLNAINKTKDIDKKEFTDFEDTIDDGL